ncbi:MAG: glycosyltransferase family 4 protein [Oscillospiraceae bacterium]|nr:glycosyltransferase family 4 protein [Oscillospiraceae bacterium]
MKKIYIDVSMIMQVSYLTGIQRVVRETVLRLLQKPALSVTLICYNSENENFRIVDSAKFSEFFGSRIGTKGQCFTRRSLAFDALRPGTVYLDMDNNWNCRLTRSHLYPILKRSGVQIVNFVYDTIPVNHPQYSHETTVMRFLSYLGAVMEYSDRVMFSAKAVEDAFRTLCERTGAVCPPACVIPLGCDPLTVQDAPDPLPMDEEGNVLPEYAHFVVSDDVKEAMAAGKYLLMVGTVEPRKNHAIVLDALDAGLDLNVIIVGKIGWNVAELRKRILNHPLYQKRLFLLSGVNDAGIAELYKNAHLLAFPTFDEGFGLPLVEAFQYGTPVIASDIPVLREVGGDYADYFDNTDCHALVQFVHETLTHPDRYAQKKAALAEYRPATWDAFADTLAEVVENASREAGAADVKNIKQMVVLTARHEDIMKSLPFIEAFMPFIKELVVCCPEWNVEPFKENYRGRLQLTFCTDDMLLQGRPLPEDHQARNFFLRCMMMQLDVLDDVFIMTDDDYRPMQPLTQEVFLKDGRYQGYYFYDLREWQGTYNRYSSFDLGAFRTRDFLLSQGYPVLQYSSHQPQIIDKRIFREMLETHPGIENHPYDEWSTYFNYGLHHHPDLFTPRPNVSMCWPGKLTSWNLYHEPGIFLFENYYAEMYEEGGIFEGFSETYYEGIEQENQEKAHLFRNAIRQQYSERQVFDSYSRFYFDQEGEYPSMVVYWDEKNRTAALHVPEYIHFAADCWTRVPVEIDPAIYEKYPGLQLRIAYHFRNTAGAPVLNSPWTEIVTGDERLLLPVRSPKTRIKQGTMLFRAELIEPETQDAPAEGEEAPPRKPPVLALSQVLSVVLT